MAGPRTERLALLLAPSPPDSLAAWIRRYITHLETQHRSLADQRTRRSHLAHFYAQCIKRGIERPQEVTHAHLQRFQRHLFLYRKPNGAPIAVNGQRIALFTVEMFFRWLVKQGVVPSNPAADLELPRRTDDLRDPLILEEMEAVLALPDIEAPEGLRDRACLELFYATGIRRMELANLLQADLDRTRGTLHVRLGKGKKDRFVPVGERALAWITKYEREARPELLSDPSEPHLFLNQYGHPLSPDGLSWRVRDYFKQAGIAKRAPATCSGTRWPPRCWITVPTSATSRRSWGTARSPAPNATRTCRSPGCTRCMPPRTRRRSCCAIRTRRLNRCAVQAERESPRRSRRRSASKNE